MQPIRCLIHSLIAALLLCGSASADVVYPKCTSLLLPKPKNTVETNLSRLDILLSFKSFQIHALPRHEGVYFQAHGDTSEPVIYNLYESAVALLAYAEDWRVGGESFTFLSTGFKHLEADGQLLNQVFLRHIEKFGRSNFVVRFSRQHQRAMQTVEDVRWFLHDAVMEKYRSVKSYLTEGDFFMLRFADENTDNNEVFAILNEENRLGATLQITYMGDAQFFQPNVTGLLQAAGLKPYILSNRLPFQYRIKSEVDPNFMSQFHKDFPTEETCEFTRYAAFTKLPKSIQDRLLFEALQSAAGRGIRVIFAGGDKITSRLFRKYGFKVYKALPTQSGSPEYLTYLKIPSPEFTKVWGQLRKSARAIERKPKDIF